MENPNKNVHVLGRAQCACPEMAHTLFTGWGYVLQAGVASTEQPYNRCVNGDNMCMNNIVIVS